MKAERHARLKEGVTYRHTSPGGGRYECVRATERDVTDIRNAASGWRMNAHDITKHGDGTIEWAYSTDGRFEDR